jgi:hypothetical protein
MTNAGFSWRDYLEVVVPHDQRWYWRPEIHWRVLTLAAADGIESAQSTRRRPGTSQTVGLRNLCKAIQTLAKEGAVERVGENRDAWLRWRPVYLTPPIPEWVRRRVLDDPPPRLHGVLDPESVSAAAAKQEILECWSDRPKAMQRWWKVP